MKVYIAITGIYETTWPSGVYASPELAMAAEDPNGKWTRTTWAGSEDVPKKYRSLHGARWTDWANNRDWDGHCRIMEFELIEAGPVRGPNKSLRQVYRESDGGWDYIDEP